MTSYCAISLALLPPEHKEYLPRELGKLSRRLTTLYPVAYSSERLRQEAVRRAAKISIQGVQPKLSAHLSIQDQTFILVDRGGEYILKPQNHLWPSLPENEHVTMQMARLVGLDVPLNGLIRNEDQEWVYFIKRFDRGPRGERYSLEDFAQLSEHNRQTKYDSSLETVLKILQTYATFPQVESVILFKMILFSFLVGNEDMHLKNFSLLSRDGKVTLSPCYDLLNTTIALGDACRDELALPLHGRRHKLRREDFMDYLAQDRLRLPAAVISKIEKEFTAALPKMIEFLDHCFLPNLLKENYKNLIRKRSMIVFKE